MSDVKWGLPPNHRNTEKSRTRWGPIAAELRANPGKWALVSGEDGLGSTSYQQHIKKGALAGFSPAGSFESTSRRRPDGRVDIYARYVGGA